jgi:hypothetical protein
MKIPLEDKLYASATLENLILNEKKILVTVGLAAHGE